MKSASLSLLEREFSLMQASYLRKLVDHVFEFNMESVEEFQQLLELAFRFGIRKIALADAMQVSQATMSRWVNKKVVPHVLMRRCTPGCVATEAQKKADTLEKKYKKR